MSLCLRIVCLGILAGVCASGGHDARAESAGPPTGLDYQVVLDVAHRGYDGITCWVHPRAGIVPRGPDRSPIVVMTMQKLWLKGSDVFFAITELRTDNLGRSWQGPIEHSDTLGRRDEAGGVVVAPADFWPAWHAPTGKLLGFGVNARYADGAQIPTVSRETVYSAYDPNSRTWSPWRSMKVSDEDRFYHGGAGSAQRVDLPNGDILLPTYTKGRGQSDYRAIVLRCRFDGETVAVTEIGEELAIAGGRGFAEPSLTYFQGRYYLTLRNDETAYVTSSPDGLRFDPPREWTFEDGAELGSYNTQQHWVTHRDGLFLVYTRRAGNNAHVPRHRAPLFIAQVDPVTLTLRRSTERILVPDRGARLGNFGVTKISPDETWVSVAEWMQTFWPQRIIPVDNARGADNSVYVARILWNRPNSLPLH